MGIDSLPVLLGVNGAGRAACLTMAIPQAVVVTLLYTWERPWHALAVGLLLAIQLVLMGRFLKDPRGRAQWYSALGVNFFVIGMLVAAFGVQRLAVALP
jgi:chlorophyll synthase